MLVFACNKTLAAHLLSFSYATKATFCNQGNLHQQKVNT